VENDTDGGLEELIVDQQRSGRPIAALSVSAVAAVLFAALAFCVPRANVVTELDERIAADLHDYQKDHPDLKSFLEKVTHVGSVETLITVALLVSLALLQLRHVGLTAIWLIVLIGGEYLNRWLKDIFSRPRLPYADAKGWSFPSGHAMLSMIGYGMVAYLLVTMRPRGGWCAVPVIALILLIGFSRLFLGAHYLSDVVGGFAAGLAWLGIWIALIETIRGKAASATVSL
jgi:undecaprenyl-diphosphatase